MGLVDPTLAAPPGLALPDAAGPCHRVLEIVPERRPALLVYLTPGEVKRNDLEALIDIE
jgi:hypothetical protein